MYIMLNGIYRYVKCFMSAPPLLPVLTQSYPSMYQPSSDNPHRTHPHPSSAQFLTPRAMVLTKDRST
ncbi:hypothetical protein K6U52_13120 [Vibrio vulnificus]|uniref:hypothetical protein n=1 Tax=Vibrio vulnificus TaxID=672 RepID=UPI001EEB3C2A|nr:hypothetical protein [Vibrio vulnificus]MCG6314181.1 hypothetical protein [Vibrio vulnificus]